MNSPYPFSILHHIAALNDLDSIRDNPEYLRGQIELAAIMLDKPDTVEYDDFVESIRETVIGIIRQIHRKEATP